MALPLTQEEEALLTRIAWLYYFQGLTQEQIARQLGFSRTKIVRMIAKSHEAGLVTIEIASPFKACFEMEKEIKEQFGLLDAIVVPAGPDEASNKRGVARAAALYLEEVLKERDVVGSGWGTTLFEVGRQLKEKPQRDLTLVQLMGGTYMTSDAMNPVEIVKLLATRLGARGFWLNTPAVVDSAEIREAILSDEGVHQVFEMAKLANKALVGVGDVTEQSAVVRCGIVRREQMARLVSQGAVGDILGQQFDIMGQPVASDFGDRMIALPLAELRKIPMVIGVAEGRRKMPSILGALRGRYMNVLITDEATAAQVVKAERTAYGKGAVR